MKPRFPAGAASQPLRSVTLGVASFHGSTNGNTDAWVSSCALPIGVETNPKKSAMPRNKACLMAFCSTFHEKCQIVLSASGPVTLLADAIHDVPHREFLVAQWLAVERIVRHPAAAERREFCEGLG